MGTATRQAATEARKAQITEATIAVLSTRGYAATTFEAICEQAGLSSKRLISYHFSSKDELFAAVAARVVTDASAFMRSALDSAVGGRELLSAYIRSSLEFIAVHPDHVRALQQIIFNAVPVWGHETDAAVERLAALFADGQRTGTFRHFEPRVMATAVRAAIDSAAPLLLDGFDPQVCGDELSDLFDRATRP